MNSNQLQSTNHIRTLFTQAMSNMYQQEVPLYKKLRSLTEAVNKTTIEQLSPLTAEQTRLLTLEHHGAIRLGQPSELAMMRRLFAVMGMHAVDYYDLSVAGIPVHSTAFRALKKSDIDSSPFRVFCSLLRLDLIDDEPLREKTQEILEKRQIFSEDLLSLIELSEDQGGLNENQSCAFINEALEVFRWQNESTVSKSTYKKLKASHGLIADIVSFKGPHINHLTPKVLDIDACRDQFTVNRIKAKAIIEGPPKRQCPILLRQTSFLAIAEDVTFSDGEMGSHTARFGEVEQRGIALTPKGRELYDKLLLDAKNGNETIEYETRLHTAFKNFPDTYDEIRLQGLAYFYYFINNSEDQKNIANIKGFDLESLMTDKIIEAKPIIYEDFLPVSAAGIFSSNLRSKSATSSLSMSSKFNLNNNRQAFEAALGVKLRNSFDLYAKLQQASLNTVKENLLKKQ